MLYSIETPQYRLHQALMANLGVLSGRYTGGITPIPRAGVSDEQLKMVTELSSIATGQLSDYWNWMEGESVTAVLARNGGELSSVLSSWAKAIRSCLEHELFPETRAGRDGSEWLLSDLIIVEEDLEKFVASTALLNKTHLMMEEHFINAVSEVNRLERHNLQDVNGSDSVAVFSMASDELYRPLRAAWQEYFTAPSEESLAIYITAAEALNSGASPLINPAMEKSLQPNADEIAQTESALDRLIAISLVNTLEL